MASLSGVTRPGLAINGLGLLLTHDWTQLHTPHGLLDPKETIPVEDSHYKTVSFPISSVSQFQACVLGKMICDEERVKNCPVEFESRFDPCSSCSVKPLSAVVQVTYKITDIVSGGKERVLCENVKSELYMIMNKVIQENEHVQEDIFAFLQKFGSHVQLGRQSLGKAFVRMVVVGKECNKNHLNEIAGEIFAACDEHEKLLTSTQEGSWYNPKPFFNTLSWSNDKRQLLETVKLRISHLGVKAKTASLTEWRNSPGDHPQMLGGMDNSKIVPVWDLISNPLLQFLNSEELSSAIKKGWENIVSTSKPQNIIPQNPKTIMPERKDQCIKTPHSPSAINIPDVNSKWYTLAEELGMKEYFPCKLPPQKVRCLQKMPKNCEKKEELVWRVLDQLMLTNSNCREQEISNYAKTAQQTSQPKTRPTRPQGRVKDNHVSPAPHPMDVMLLVFMCSDFMLRQVLARKLFLCRIAIPFMVPMISEEKVEMLIWPLRSIVMEWENKEDALVKCELNNVTFMRCGNTTQSKSKMLNELLSPSGHPVFFHDELPCGNKKRLISNGIVEISHFLPSGSQQDQFKEPSLFFNLRGNVCDHPVQHSVLMNLPASVVILVDIGEIEKPEVQNTLKTTLEKKKQDVVIVLTKSENHDEAKIEELEKTFGELVGDPIDGEEGVVYIYTYEADGGKKNKSAVHEEIKEAIARKMVPRTKGSIESFKEALALSPCVIDEIANTQCREGKDEAENLLACMKEIDVCERKEKLLPQQGDCLLEIGKLLRQLHRNKDASMTEEGFKNSIKTIRKNQSDTSKDDQFVMKVTSLFGLDDKTKSFAVRWVQLELDAISRDILPEVQSDKNKKWNALTKVHSQEDKSSIKDLKRQVHEAEQKLSAASCGWEHLMREIGQLYEVSLDLKLMDRAGSKLNVSALPDIMGRQLLDGYPVELMDGDHGFIPIEWVKAVFRSLAQLAGQDKKIFVLSVMGIQSSGKSTLLNTMFGLDFAVSAGRCTRGIYAQLLPIDDSHGLVFDYILVIDSEGLKSQELEDQKFERDNELATLVIGLADMALVNLKGENMKEITDVLQIVVHAFIRMNLADKTQKRQCMFIHQNVSAINAQQKLTGDRQKLLQELDRMTREASIVQGHSSDTISSFNNIISFDTERDVVYFSDLWNGNPPMATVNQGYSIRAAQTRQSIMNQIKTNFNGSITIADFMDRMDDMWTGVLSDDFIFSFRSTLAAKSYLDVEREFGRLTLLVEQKLVHWLNYDCQVHMENAESEEDLHARREKLENKLEEKVADLIAENVQILEDFFKNHPACDIIVQWKDEKKSSVDSYCKRLLNQQKKEMESMKLRKLVLLREASKNQEQEEEIMSKALALAEGIRGQSPSERAINQQFDDLWEKWAARLISTSDQPEINALGDLLAILYRYSGMVKFFKQEIGRTSDSRNPTVSKKLLQDGDILKEHIIVKAKPWNLKGLASKLTKRQSHYIAEALEKANAILESVVEKVEGICQQNITFNIVYGREILDDLFAEITKHNSLPFAKAEFEFTSGFNAMMAVHVVRYAAPMFDQMTKQFEEKHGVKARIKAYRDRVFKRFKNTVFKTSSELTASEDFCEAIKGKVKEYVQRGVEDRVTTELYNDIGHTKYDLIIKMLDAIVQKTNNSDTEKEKNFHALNTYVSEPFTYATCWLKDFGEEKFFCLQNGDSKYSNFASEVTDKRFGEIVSSVKKATDTVGSLDKAKQYSEWIIAFCDNIKTTLPFNASQLKLSTIITDFESFQKFLKRDLKVLEEAIKKEFSNTNKSLVVWMNNDSPYVKVVKHLWGCTALCPICNEPCSNITHSNLTPHHCVQHRPSGLTGGFMETTNVLLNMTCSYKITSDLLGCCGSFNKQCRLTEHCNRTDEEEDDPIHPFHEYKKFLPDWDINPNKDDTASKFWQWAICTFQEQLLKYYRGLKLEIPTSWREVSKQEASNSLRRYDQKLQ